MEGSIDQEAAGSEQSYHGLTDQDITDPELMNITRRCKDLSNHNEGLVDRVETMCSKLVEANASVKSFEEKFMRQVESENKMRNIVKQMEDYVLTCDEEMGKLQGDVFTLQARSNSWEEEKSCLITEMKRNELEHEEEKMLLREKLDFLNSGEANQSMLRKAKVGSLSSQLEKSGKERAILDEKFSKISAENEAKSSMIQNLTENNRKLSSDLLCLQKKLSGASSGKSELQCMLASSKSDLNMLNNELETCKIDLYDSDKLLSDREKQNKSILEQLKFAVIANENIERENKKLQRELETATAMVSGLQKQVKSVEAHSEKYKAERNARNTEVSSLKRDLVLSKGTIEQLKEANSTLIVRIENCEVSNSWLDRECKGAREDDRKMCMELEVKQSELECLVNERVSLEKQCSQLKFQNLELKESVDCFKLKLLPEQEKREAAENKNNNLFCELKNLKSDYNLLEIVLQEKKSEFEERISKSEVENRQVTEELVKARNAIHVKDKEISTAASGFSIEEKELKELIAVLRSDNIALSSSLNEAKKNVGIVTKDLDAAGNLIAEHLGKMETIEGNYNSVKIACASQLQDLEKLAKEESKLQDCVVKLRNENEQVKRMCSESDHKIANLESAGGKFREDNDMLVKELEEKAQQIEDLEMALLNREKQLKDFSEEYATASKEIVKLKKVHKKALTDAIDQKYQVQEMAGCHAFERKQRKTCERQIEEKEEELCSLEKKLQVCDMKAAEMKARIKQADLDKIEFEKRVARMQGNNESLQGENEKLAKAKLKVVQEFEEKIQYLHACIAEDGKEMNHLKAAVQEMKSVAGEYKKANDVMDAANLELRRRIGDLDEDLQRENEAAKTLQKDVGSERSSNQALKKMLNSVQDQLARKDEEARPLLSMLECSESEASSLKNAILSLEARNQFLEDAKKSLEKEFKERDSYVKRMESEMEARRSQQQCLLEKLKVQKSDLKQSLYEKEIVEAEKDDLELKFMKSFFEMQREGDNGNTRQPVSRNTRAGRQFKGEEEADDPKLFHKMPVSKLKLKHREMREHEMREHEIRSPQGHPRDAGYASSRYRF